MPLYVYILKCRNGSFYTGLINDLEWRVFQHNYGCNEKAFTYKRRPVKLVFSEKFEQNKRAIEWEKKIKKWTRVKKEALINRRYGKLKELSACSNDSHFRNKEIL